VREIHRPVEVRVEGLTPSGQLEEHGFFGAVALLTLKTGDPTTDSLGATGCPALRDLCVQGGQLLVVEPDRDLCRHTDQPTTTVNQTVCVLPLRVAPATCSRANG